MDLGNRLRAAERAVALAQKRLTALGPIVVRGGLMRAGDTVLNNNDDFVDGVYEATLFGCTVFLGNVRIATRATAKGDSKRAIGTTANDEVSNLVFERGGTFRGTTTTLGREWVIVYVPIDDVDGRRVGMLATYRELVSFSD